MFSFVLQLYGSFAQRDRKNTIKKNYILKCTNKKCASFLYVLLVYPQYNLNKCQHSISTVPIFRNDLFWQQILWLRIARNLTFVVILLVMETTKLNLAGIVSSLVQRNLGSFASTMESFAIVSDVSLVGLIGLEYDLSFVYFAIPNHIVHCKYHRLK